MDKEIYETKMGKIKKLVKITFFISMILSLVILAMLIIYNFVGVFYIQTAQGTKYQDGFTYPGWQSIFYGMGEMMIQGYKEFGFDIYTCLGLFIPFFAVIICSCMYMSNRNKKGTNKKKAVLEFVMAITILFGVIMLFNCDKFTIQNAKSQQNNSYASYYDEYLSKALNGEKVFKKLAYPYILLIVGILISLVKVFNGLLLLKQKKLAVEFKKGNEK